MFPTLCFVTVIPILFLSLLSTMVIYFEVGMVANLTNAIIVVIILRLMDVIELEGNLQIMDTRFSTMEGLLINIHNQFQDQ